MEVQPQDLQQRLYRHSLSKWWVYTLNTDSILRVLPTRAKHTLYRVVMERGYRLLDDLRDLTPADFIKERGCGKVTLKQLCRVLSLTQEREHALDMLLNVE